MIGTERPEAAPLPLGEHLAVLRARKWWLAGVLAVTVAGSVGLSFLQDPVYTSTAQVLVRPVAPAARGATPEPPNMTTERQLARSVPVAELVATSLGTDEPVEDLLAGLSIDVIDETEIIEFAYGHASAPEAQRRAQAFAEAYLSFRREQAATESASAAQSLRAQIGALNRQLRTVIGQLADATTEAARTSLEAQRASLAAQIGVLSTDLAEVESAGAQRVGQVVRPADLPAGKSSPKPIRNAILALFVGAVLGVAAALLAERLDDRFRGPEGLEVTAGAPVLSVIPRVPPERQDRGMLVTLSHPDSAHAEAYRTLRTGLMFAAGGRSARTIVITSPTPGDGKTVTTANLGVAIAQAGKRVVLLSADLRKPDLHRLFGSENGAGLTDVLTRRGSVWEVLVRPDGIDNLWVLPSGSALGTPGDLLASHGMAEVLAQLRESADFVLIDTGPVLSVPDALSLGPMVDGMVLVASAERTTRGSVRQARRQLDLVKATLLGSVLNGFRGGKSYYHEYGIPRPPDDAAASEGARP